MSTTTGGGPNARGRDDELCIHYHRDFDGMVSAAVLARILEKKSGERPTWRSINYDQRTNWLGFEEGRRFAIVDFHFHPRAEYWFDHHPTTFLDDELRAIYRPSDRWQWDVDSPSCPPIILRHAEEHWGQVPEERFRAMAHWSNVIDAARFVSVEQAVFGEEPALRIMRALTVAPNPEWIDGLVAAMIELDLEATASRADVEKAYQRASRNRDRALEQFPPTVAWKKEGVLLYDASSDKIRRERFAAFYHHPDIHYSVGVIPTRAGYHVSAGENPWNPPPKPASSANGAGEAHIGTIMERYGGGGHKAVGGANPPSLAEARRVAAEVADTLRQALRTAK